MDIRFASYAAIELMMGTTFKKEPELKELKSQLDSLSRQINLTLSTKDENKQNPDKGLDSISPIIIPIKPIVSPPMQNRGMRM